MVFTLLVNKTPISKDRANAGLHTSLFTRHPSCHGYPWRCPGTVRVGRGSQVFSNPNDSDISKEVGFKHKRNLELPL